MTATDFQYDGLNLSDWGYMICQFDGNGSIETINNGAEINFETVPVLNGSKHAFINSNYEECIEATFQICKSTCDGTLEEIKIGEFRDMATWLNRREFHKFKILDKQCLDFYYEGTFNVSKIELGGVILGLELKLTTNRPYAIHEEVVLNIASEHEGDTFTVIDVSDDEDFTYPVTTVKCLAAGDLTIHNDRENRTTYVGGCSVGEIITMDYPTIESSMDSQSIQDRFNFVFPRIAGDFVTKENRLTFSMPCEVQMRYRPAVKVGLP